MFLKQDQILVLRRSLVQQLGLLGQVFHFEFVAFLDFLGMLKLDG